MKDIRVGVVFDDVMDLFDLGEGLVVINVLDDFSTEVLADYEQSDGKVIYTEYIDFGEYESCENREYFKDFLNLNYKDGKEGDYIFNFYFV